MREIEGPAKNLLLERQGNAQQDTKTQCSCWYFEHGIKRIFTKLGRFSYSFAEITDGMSTELGSQVVGRLFQPII